MLTQERLKESLHYSPNTGEFTRKLAASQRVKVGDIAGSINDKGYRYIMVDGINYSAHKLAFLYVTGKMPSRHVDHINHSRSDNRWENIREAGRMANARNQSKRHDNKSGVSGVYWHNSNKKWVAQICGGERRINLGAFTTIEEAIAARKAAEKMIGFHPNHGQ